MLRLVQDEILDNGLTMTTLELSRGSVRTPTSRFRETSPISQSRARQLALPNAEAADDEMDAERWDGLS